METCLDLRCGIPLTMAQWACFPSFFSFCSGFLCIILILISLWYRPLGTLIYHNTRMDYKPFIYGGLASMTAELGTFPIDTTKTRLQLQGQVTDSKQKTIRYRGMLHAFFKISREEGFRALFNGVAPALLRQATYGSLKLGIYHFVKRTLVKEPKGIIAGAMSSAICNPTDVLKIRMQAEYKTGVQLSMTKSFGKMFSEEGLRGLYRGVGPTSQRAAVIAGVELPVYDSAKRFILNNKLMGDHPGTHFVASAIAGLAGAIASNPIDVAKTRMMNQRNLKVKSDNSQILYRSAAHCITMTMRTEGFFALYRGFIPNFARLCPWNIFFFMAYEQYKNIGSTVLP